MTGTWEHAYGSSSGEVYEFTENTFRWTHYGTERYYEYIEASYSESENEIRFDYNGDTWTLQFQFVEDNLVIDDRVFTQVNDGSLSFDISEHCN
jgi:hypothetical protein